MPRDDPDVRAVYSTYPSSTIRTPGDLSVSDPVMRPVRLPENPSVAAQFERPEPMSALDQTILWDRSLSQKRILDQRAPPIWPSEGPMESRAYETVPKLGHIDSSGSDQVDRQGSTPLKRYKLPTPATEEPRSRVTGFHIPTIAATIEEFLSKNLMSKEFVKQYGNPRQPC